MPIEDKSCENYARLARCSAGFTYASWQNHFIGADTIVLAGTVPDGKDHEFAASWEFVEENHIPGRFGFTCEDGKEIYSHVAECSSDACKAANAKLGNVSASMHHGVPMGGVLVASQLQAKNGSERLVLVGEDGWDAAIDVLAPIFEMYIEHRDDFVWPGEGRVRLAGYSNVTFGLDSKGITFKGDQGDEGAIEVPYDAIRKVRFRDRDIWRNPELYHVEISHPNEESFDRGGNVALELREDMEGVEQLVQEILNAKVSLSRIEKK